jgi:hypothetical protein
MDRAFSTCSHNMRQCKFDESNARPKLTIKDMPTQACFDFIPAHYFAHKEDMKGI